MNDDVLLYFSSFHSGMEILKQVCTAYRTSYTILTAKGSTDCRC
jgi:hypothetical protein